MCVQVTAYPKRAPIFSKQIDTMIIIPCFNLQLMRFALHEVFPESYLNTPQLDILEELTEILDLRFDCSIMAATHLAYLELASHRILGTDPDQGAEAFIQSSTKINFALGDAPGDAGEVANYTFEEKALFFFF